MDPTHSKDDATKPPDTDIDEKNVESALSGELVSAGSQQLQRKLGGKEIQLFAVGGAIGTCMPSNHSSWASSSCLLQHPTDADVSDQLSSSRWERPFPRAVPPGYSWASWHTQPLFCRLTSVLVCCFLHLCYPDANRPSGNGHLPPHPFTLRPAGWVLGRRCLELCNGMELFLPHGFIVLPCLRLF